MSIQAYSSASHRRDKTIRESLYDRYQNAGKVEAERKELTKNRIYEKSYAAVARFLQLTAEEEKAGGQVLFRTIEKDGKKEKGDFLGVKFQDIILFPVSPMAVILVEKCPGCQEFQLGKTIIRSLEELGGEMLSATTGEWEPSDGHRCGQPDEGWNPLEEAERDESPREASPAEELIGALISFMESVK